MAVTKEIAKREMEVKEKVPAEQWIGRLTVVLKTIDDMDRDERSAALAFLRSKYRQDWPSENY
jgi:hypothetical protein